MQQLIRNHQSGTMSPPRGNSSGVCPISRDECSGMCLGVDDQADEGRASAGPLPPSPSPLITWGCLTSNFGGFQKTRKQIPHAGRGWGA